MTRQRNGINDATATAGLWGGTPHTMARHELLLFTDDGSFSAMTRVTQSLLFHKIPAVTQLCVVGTAGAVHHALRVETTAHPDAVARWVTTVGPTLCVTGMEVRASKT